MGAAVLQGKITFLKTNGCALLKILSHNNNGFIAYNQQLFSLEDQFRLKRFIETIKRRGAYYILTNAAHEAIREIFLTENDRLIELQRPTYEANEVLKLDILNAISSK